VHGPHYVPIEWDFDREGRTARLAAAAHFETESRALTIPATDDEQRIAVRMPGGFDYKEAEVAQATLLSSSAEIKFDWRAPTAVAHSAASRAAGITPNGAGSGPLELGLVLASERRHLGPTFEPGILEDRGDLGIGHEAVIALLVPVENHPDPLVVIGIAKDVRTPGPVLLSLLSALGRERVPEAVEILDLDRGQDHRFLLGWKSSIRVVRP
jgi:hypothetical protein